MTEDFGALAVLMAIAGAFAYTQAPRHWQNLLGFLLIVFGFLPLVLASLVVLKEPALLVPAVFLLGIVMAWRRRAS